MCKSGASDTGLPETLASKSRVVLGFVLEPAFARTRSWLKNPNFPRIIDAWKFTYAQIRTRKLGCCALGDAATARRRKQTTTTRRATEGENPKGERRKSYIMMALSLRMRRAANSLFHPLLLADLEVTPPL
jgi:hypothetical protein